MGPEDKGEENKYLVSQRRAFSQPNDGEITRFLLEMEKDIQNKILYYRGYYRDEKGAVQIINNNKPLVNEAGIQYANRQFRHFLNKGASLANLTSDQVTNIILPYASRVRRHLLMNLGEYQILSIATIDELKNDIAELAFLNLTRSIDDKQREFTYQGQQINETHQYAETTPEKKRLKIGW